MAVKIMCRTEELVKLSELSPFQGDLKKRTVKNIGALAASIKDEGLLMPFAVWRHDGVNSLLDGHGRYAALMDMLADDQEIAEQYFPVIFIEADDEDGAKKTLLQITSQYGKVTRDGALKFCASIPMYKAPAINGFVHRKPVQRKLKENNMEQVIRIAVPNDKAQAVLELFKSVDYIRVL